MSLTIEDTVRSNLKSEEIAALEKGAAEFDELVKASPRKRFEPCAYYDYGLDCIRVVVRDCSVYEFRINEWLTVLHDTDPESDAAPVGFTLKGIKARTRGQHEVVVQLAAALDELAKRDPVETVAHWVFALKKLSHKNNVREVAVPA